MFLSRLNEIGGGRGNVFSFGINVENFEVFENDIFDCKVLCMVGEGEWNSVGPVSSFCDVCSAISWSRCLPVVTVESG